MFIKFSARRLSNWINLSLESWKCSYNYFIRFKYHEESELQFFTSKTIFFFWDSNPQSTQYSGKASKAEKGGNTMETGSSPCMAVTSFYRIQNYWQKISLVLIVKHHLNFVDMHAQKLFLFIFKSMLVIYFSQTKLFTG